MKLKYLITMQQPATPECEIAPSLETGLKNIIDEPRRKTGFFYPRLTGMSLSAAGKLQDRSAQNQELKRSNRYARVDLWVAAIAFLAIFIRELLSDNI